MIFKANAERREITAPVLLPETVDAHGDIYSEEEVLKACRNFNEFCRKSNLQHSVQLEKDDLEFIESYVTMSKTVIDGKEYPKGTWMLTGKCHSDIIWESVKNGTFTGWSIGCRVLSTEA